MNYSLSSLGLFTLSVVTQVWLRKGKEKERENKTESSRSSQPPRIDSNPPRLDANASRKSPMAFDNSNLGGEVGEEDLDNDTPGVRGAGAGAGMPRNDSESSLGSKRGNSVNKLPAPSLSLREVALGEAGSTLLLAGRVLLCSLILVCCGTYVLGNLRKRRS
jgi:hypothetical protein